MRTLGLVTAVVVAAIAISGIAVGVRSVPDIKRYLRIRAM